jgi:23S rRNA (cytosine1962-C5)-methyltransferase
MKEVQVQEKAVRKFRSGYPLIKSEDLIHFQSDSDNWVKFVDRKKNFLGVGYLSPQNKGIGWFLSTQDEPLGKDFFVNKFLTAKALRENLFADELTTAFRLFNGEGDGVGGVTIDLYDNYIVFSWYNAFIYSKKELLIEAFQSVYPEITGAYEKIRFESSVQESSFVYGAKAEEPLIVIENGVKYATYLNEGLMTGIFLDQKEVRGRLVDGFSSGKSLLNMFSYTGAFSVAAAMGGASETTSVDLAKRSLPKTKEQFEVNGFNLEEQRIVVMDVFEYFKYARRNQLSYDVIVLDPPSFARNKKKTFSVAKNYGELVEDSMDILSSHGWLIASTNAANVSMKKYREMIEAALKNKNVWYKITDEYHLPSDFHVAKSFSEGNYLKVLFIEVKKNG